MANFTLIAESMGLVAPPKTLNWRFSTMSSSHTGSSLTWFLWKLYVICTMH